MQLLTSHSMLCRKHVMVASIDVSRDAQLRGIEASFQASNENFSLESLKHPNKPNITAVESYAVLPDVGIWANQYDLFKFSERPGERPVDVCPFLPYTLTSLILILYINQVDDPRLDCAILRPMKTEHVSFLSFYLTKDNEQVLKHALTSHLTKCQKVKKLVTMFIPHKKCTQAD